MVSDCTISDAHELHSRSTLKTNVCIFLCISFRKVLFYRLSKLSSGGVGGGWWSLNNFLNAARRLGLIKCFTNFPANMLLFSFRKKICTVPFLNAQEMHSWITLKANVCSVYLGKKINIPKTKYDFTWWVVRGWVGGRLNNFFKAACCLGLVKCFTIFHFNWNFWKFNYFSAFWSSIFSIKTLEFSRQSVL